MRDKVSWPSLLTFQYVMPLLKCAYAENEKVTIEQFGILPDSIKVAETVPLLEDAWKREYTQNPESKMALVKALARVFKWNMIIRFFAKLMSQMMEMLSPMLIFKFTEYVEKSESDITL